MKDLSSLSPHQKMEPPLFFKDLDGNLELKSHAFVMIPRVHLAVDDGVEFFESTFKHLSAKDIKTILESCLLCEKILESEAVGSMALEIYGFLRGVGKSGVTSLTQETPFFQHRCLHRIVCQECVPLENAYRSFYVSSGSLVGWILNKADFSSRTLFRVNECRYCEKPLTDQKGKFFTPYQSEVPLVPPPYIEKDKQVEMCLSSYRKPLKVFENFCSEECRNMCKAESEKVLLLVPHIKKKRLFKEITMTRFVSLFNPFER
jgi:hypothetical protein